jgi:hypothetical protein
LGFLLLAFPFLFFFNLNEQETLMAGAKVFGYHLGKDSRDG